MKGYQVLSKGLRQGARKPKAKKVHHTEEKLRENLSIPKDKKLTPALRHAQDNMEANRAFGKRKSTRKLFKKASSLQHSAMDDYATDFEKEGKAARTEAIEGSVETMGDKYYDAKREKKINTGKEAQMEASEIAEFRKWKANKGK